MTTPTLVLIPGLGSDGIVWRRTVDALGGGDLRCLIGDTLQDATLVGMARRVLGQAPERFALGGVSMGGMVAMEVMRLAPERVSHLALFDTLARPDESRRRMARRLTNLVVGFSRDFRRLAARSLDSLVDPAASEDVRRDLVEMSVRVGAKTYIRQNRAVAARSDLREVLPTIIAPAAVIVGENDRLTPAGMSREIAGLIMDATLQVIPGCGHLPPIEKPEASAALLRKLLSRRPQSASR